MQMNDDPRESQPTSRPRAGGASAATWVLVAGLAAGAAGVGYGVNSHSEAARLTETQQANVQTVAEMQKEMQTLTSRLTAQEARERELTTALATAQQAAAERQAQAQTSVVRNSAGPARTAARRAARPVDDPRFKQMEQRFADQDEKLAGTQRMVESTRSDLESRISSTSDELNGSIARTSEEVAALRRRGERDYFEFDIPKSKQLQRVGPVSVALRKADTKRKRYNLDMMVDDNKLEKKNVNLYEPVYVNTPELAQPLELVVNKVDKDRVKGYISVPKYKRSELASTGADRTRLATPANPLPEE